MDNEEILRLCESIQESPGSSTPEIKEFKKKFPKLYAYVSTERYDSDMLRTILPYRNDMNRDVVGTNMKVAERIADKYLYNDTTLQRPSENDMIEHRRRILRHASTMNEEK